VGCPIIGQLGGAVLKLGADLLIFLPDFPEGAVDNVDLGGDGHNSGDGGTGMGRIDPSSAVMV